MEKRELFEKYKNKQVKLCLKPDFVITGVVTEVLDDCIEFTTPTKSSVINFEQILSAIQLED